MFKGKLMTNFDEEVAPEVAPEPEAAPEATTEPAPEPAAPFWPPLEPDPTPEPIVYPPYEPPVLPAGFLTVVWNGPSGVLAAVWEGVNYSIEKLYPTSIPEALYEQFAASLYYGPYINKLTEE